MICRFITLALLALVTVLATAAAFDESAFPDTKENRMAQAKRVLMGTPIEETLEGIVQEAIRVKGQEKANEIRAAIARSDTTDLSTAMQRAYATTFTAAELAFVAEYSNSEIGKRVQRKMPGYVAKVHPAMKAYAKEIFEDIEEEKNKGGKGKGAKKKGGGIEVVAEDAAAASTSSEL